MSTPTPFDRFWDAYPRKLDKGDARKAWNQVLPNKHLVAVHTVMDGLDGWVRYWTADRTEAKFIPHPATWLRHRRWEDTPPEISTKPLAILQGGQQPTGGRAAIDEYRRRHGLEGAS